MQHQQPHWGGGPFPGEPAYPGFPSYPIKGQDWNSPAMPLYKGDAVSTSPAKKGNICAYAPSTPPHYTKLNFVHWPSQDYVKPHPKGFLHTMHTEQQLGQYIPYK
ncbi:hypothetical protein [Oceanobacillus halotolerans]|uniref:hypothetical protein n=1 Tax=Oceanobacillus halotolerans TaxID=2663380 RepID=UPI0013D9AC6E|nr:hypothetical protein [Oceanobacillus halotolerans]